MFVTSISLIKLNLYAILIVSGQNSVCHLTENLAINFVYLYRFRKEQNEERSFHNVVKSFF